MRRDARENRERLLGAAREVFAEAGLQASLEEVARRAGVSIGTLYHRFGNRTALVDAALCERVEHSAAMAERALEDPDPWPALVHHLGVIAEWQAHDRGFTEVCVHSLPAETRTEVAKARGHAVMTELVARAHGAGVLRSDVGLTDLGLLVWSVVRATEGLRPSHPDSWKRHLAVLLDGLRPAAAHPLPGVPLQPEDVQKAMSAAVTQR